ncbi:hypothetical protein WJX73_006697 [Symbiochloris irregularis]|uniref:Uncharacterized protein n=1 Tax=Symbiochloris irregularis TaxID=706552 RepID=A0AAW1NJ38_9CHLO
MSDLLLMLRADSSACKARHKGLHRGLHTAQASHRVLEDLCAATSIPLQEYIVGGVVIGAVAAALYNGFKAEPQIWLRQTGILIVANWTQICELTDVDGLKRRR